jgi:hypothetical protein
MSSTVLKPYEGPEVILILRDGDGTVEIAGVSRPEQFDKTSPAHLVGKFIGDNIHVLVGLAAKGDDLSEPDEEPAISGVPEIIGPHRERTIIVPDDRQLRLFDGEA